MYKQDNTNKSRSQKYDERTYSEAVSKLRAENGFAASEIRGKLLDILSRNPDGNRESIALMRALDDHGHDSFVSTSAQNRD